jgi:hypothetical protein
MSKITHFIILQDAVERFALAACAATVTNFNGVWDNGITPIIRTALGASPLRVLFGGFVAMHAQNVKKFLRLFDQCKFARKLSCATR